MALYCLISAGFQRSRPDRRVSFPAQRSAARRRPPADIPWSASLSTDGPALRHVPLTPGYPLVLAVFACLLLAGCGSGSKLARPNVVYAPGPVIAASEGQATQAGMAEGNAANLEPKKKAPKKAYGKKPDNGAEKTVLRERDDWGPARGLFPPSQAGRCR